MEITKTELDGVLIIKPKIFEDKRGHFLEMFNQEKYKDVIGGEYFVQDNRSLSRKGVIRGMHWQKKNPQGKLVTCTYGKVVDMIVDIDPDSVNFKKSIAITLDSSFGTQIYVPPGYAHGFQALSDIAEFQYKCTSYYRPDDECGFAWNDPIINLDWPIADPLISDKDTKLPLLYQALEIN